MATINIIPDHDTYGNSHYPNKDYGSETIISIKYGPSSYQKQAFLKWSDGLIQSYKSKIKSINSATLYLYVNYTEGISAATVYQAAADWNESTLTWNNKPAVTGSNYGPLNLSSTGWKSLNITTLFTGWFEQTINRYGIRIWDSDNNDKGVTIYSSENADYKPYVLVDYVPKPQGASLLMLLSEAYENHDKLWKPKLTLPKDLGFSY